MGVGADLFGRHGGDQFGEGKAARFPSVGVGAEELSVRHLVLGGHDRLYADARGGVRFLNPSRDSATRSSHRISNCGGGEEAVPSGCRPSNVLAPIHDNETVAAATAPNRRALIRRGQRLEYFTIGYNSAESLASIVAGLIAGSVSLVGFGLDSLIEVASGAALLWRLHHDLDQSRREQVEHITVRIVGWCFVALALYIACESGSTLIGRAAPERSIPGIIVAAVSVLVMPLLARAKRRVAAGIGSGAMSADSKQADFCTYLSAILLGGLLLNALFGWWWADTVAGLGMVPIIAKEGIDGIRGRACGDGCG